MPELGALGEAAVLSVGPCPPPAPGDGPLVTGVFRHQAKEVIDVYVEGADKPIGCTPNHPFWSEDRQEFVPAGQLRRNERLRTATGDTPRITGIRARAGKQCVYNIEVDGEHVYCVGSHSILVHNKAMKAPLPIPQVSDPKLRNLVSDLYKGAKGPNPIGTGSTADAVRNELVTGLPTHGRFHSQKAREYVNALSKWLKNNPNAPYPDRLVAQSLLDDLTSALGGN
jgi:hypothetical protein